ncbi:bifunctional diguanylate cyclase/phosphodiesterase [Idiomarina seosinensis]|uniref:putative bifunctional diguanylate cyclase/phosphodiesterase n=1 Tax=Idiomarina seosinensis TaxID=281739 RepID=UPI0038511EC2
MPFTFTQSAANKTYASLIIFFVWVGLLGVFERLLTADSQLMSVIPMLLVFVSLAFAVILLLIASHRSPPRLTRLCPYVTALGFIAFLYLQAILWGLLPKPEPDLFRNPFNLAIAAIVVLAFFSGLAVRLRYPDLDLDVSRPTLITAAGIVSIGVLVWFSISFSSINQHSDNARQKIQLIGSMINEKLDDQQKALGRIKSRLDNLDAEAFVTVSAIDMARYIEDYEIIEGMILYDDKLNIVSDSEFAKSFNRQGLLDSTAVEDWLAEPAEQIRLAANAASMETSVPVIMVSIPIVHSQNEEKYQILALLDMNDLVARDYVDYLDMVRTYMSFGPQTLISMHGESNKTVTLAQLQDRYAHGVSATVRLLNSIDHTFYSFMVDYSKLETTARFYQLMLWLTAAFAMIFIVMADTKKQLRVESRKLALMARFDDITGLLRRDAFNQQSTELSLACEGCRRAAIFVNLDGFNPINDSLGHNIGDQVLFQAAKRIQENGKFSDVIARFSNDEFILYYKDTVAYQLKKEVQSILHALAEVYHIDGLEIHLTASAGVAVSCQMSVSTETLVQQADIAMSVAKKTGGNQYCFFQQPMSDQFEKRVRLRNQLQSAMNNDQLEVFYQPIYRASDHKLVSVESLVRWRLNGDFISPADFIPIAEDTGQVMQLGEQVVKKVFKDISENPDLQALTVAINVSPQQFQRGEFGPFLLRQVDNFNLKPGQLTLELTETVELDEGSIEKLLQSLRDKGFHIAIDDFGTGFSSLSYLSRQPADIVKIDRAFTFGIESEGSDRDLLEAMINMCHKLDKTAVVEGIETESSAEFFSKFSNLRLQGYYFSKPLPVNDLITLIQAHNDKP